MYLLVINLIIIFIYILQKTRSSFHSLQQNFYNENNRYLKWIFNNIGNVICWYDILFLVLTIVLYFVNFKYLYFIITILVIGMNIIYYFSKKKEQVKLPLKYTSRIKRLYFTFIVIHLFIIFMLFLSLSNIYIYYILLAILIIFNSLMVFFVNIINLPVEKMVYLYYRNKAISKLKSLNNLEVIGVTGSYGKTSCKNILNTILNTKYDVVTTPKNFNTKYGLIITINNNLDKFNEYFIAEMGAFKRGSIDALCKMVKPKYGILTTIGEAHLETFGSSENIIKGKFELIESLPSDGTAVLNYDDLKQRNYKIKNKCNVLWISLENSNVYAYASNIKMSYKGMSFEVFFEGDKKSYLFETKLLGKPNVYNILESIALGRYLGIEIDRLQTAVKRLQSVEHRLELKRMGDINIIDDAYNSNPIGAKMALDVLGLMPGKKIIVTPGMIELKDKQNYYNKEFGKYISEVCDEVILVGKNQTKYIYEGLIEKKYSTKKIHIINDVKEAFGIINSIKDDNTYALLENDLPDIFNEK